MSPVLLALSGFGLQVGAISAVPTLSVCERYTSETRNELANIDEFLVKSSTIKTMAAAQATSIRFTPPGTEFGPYASLAEGRNFINVPRGFRKLHCELVLISFLDTEAELKLADGQKRMLEACLRKGRAPNECLGEVVAANRAPVQQAYSRLPPERQRLARSVVEAAFEFLILHELGHILLSHLDRTSLDEESAKLEFEADQFALRYSIVTVGHAVGAEQNFYLLGSVDQGLLQVSSSHDSFFCRSENALNMAGLTLHLPIALYASARLPSIAGRPNAEAAVKQRREDLRYIASTGGFGIPPQHSPICRFNTLPQMEALRGDLLALARFQDRRIDRLPAAGDAAAITELLDSLITLPLLSEDGKAIRAHLLVEYAKLYSPTTRDASVTRAISRAVIEVLLPSGLVGDLADLYGVAGLRMLDENPGSRLADEDKKLIVELLLSALNILGYDDEIYAGLVRAEIRSGDCKGARDLFRKGFSEDLTGAFRPGVKVALAGDLEAAGCAP